MSGAQFWRLTTVVRGYPDPAHGGTLILRRWPQEHPTPDRLRFIHAVLRHAAERGVTFLPLPIPAQTGQSFIEQAGHLWELTPWLPGAADYETAPTTEKLRAAMAALAQFHIATADFPTPTTPRSVGRQTESSPPTSPPSIQRRLARLHQLARGEINELSRPITDATWPDLAPLARNFLAALPRAVPQAIAQLEPLADVRLPLQPCIRDVWHDHVLFTGGRVTGLIDFGAVTIDTPATDIARLLGSLAGDDPAGWQSGLAAYSAIRPLSQEESLAVFALDRSGTILAGCNWLRWLYIERRQFENPAQVIDRFRRIAARTMSFSGEDFRVC
jgi:homoserine kinase type II